MFHFLIMVSLTIPKSYANLKYRFNCFTVYLRSQVVTLWYLYHSFWLCGCGKLSQLLEKQGNVSV